MKKIFALGNALVDCEYKLDDVTLTKTRIKKGSNALAMTLAEQERILSILDENNIPLLKKAGGGNSANSMFTAACLGGNTSLGCCVAHDTEGLFYLHELNEVGVQTSEKAIREFGDPTGTCLILVTPDGERTMQSYLGATEFFGIPNLENSHIQDSDFIFIEGYLAASDLAIDAVKHAKRIKKESAKIALSFVDPSVVNFYKTGLLAMLGDRVDIIFCNEEEALTFTNTTNHEEAVNELHTYADLIVITLGKKGAFVSEQNQESFSIDGVEVTDVVDTNGAGDNFAGAFLYGLSQNLTLQQSTQLAINVSARLITQLGPRLTHDGYQQVLKDTHL